MVVSDDDSALDSSLGAAVEDGMMFLWMERDVQSKLKYFRAAVLAKVQP